MDATIFTEICTKMETIIIHHELSRREDNT